MLEDCFGKWKIKFNLFSTHQILMRLKIAVYMIFFHFVAKSLPSSHDGKSFKGPQSGEGCKYPGKCCCWNEVITLAGSVCRCTLTNAPWVSKRGVRDLCSTEAGEAEKKNSKLFKCIPREGYINLTKGVAVSADSCGSPRGWEASAECVFQRHLSKGGNKPRT